MFLNKYLTARRSVYFFKKDFVIPDEDLYRCVETSLLTPSAFNVQQWRFIHVKSPEKRKLLSDACWNQPQIENSSQVLLLVLDKLSWRDNPEKYFTHVPDEFRENMVSGMTSYFSSSEDASDREAHISCGLIAMNIMLLSQEHGYDSCPMSGFDKNRVKEIFQLPSHVMPGLVIALGKRVESELWDRPPRMKLNEALYVNTFGRNGDKGE